MAEKKTATKKVAAKKETAVKAAPAKKACGTKKATATKKEAAPKAEAEKKATTVKVDSAKYINAMNVGFRAGDVYQTLAKAKKSMTVEEIAKVANLTEQQVLLGIGWLFKEGKVVGENVADMRLA